MSTWRLFLLGGGTYCLHRQGDTEGRIFHTEGNLHTAMDIADSLARGSKELVKAVGWRRTDEGYEKEI